MEDDISSLHELFPDWTTEDLKALYLDLERNIDLVITRISEGHASQWSLNKTVPNQLAPHRPSSYATRPKVKRGEYQPKPHRENRISGEALHNVPINAKLPDHHSADPTIDSSSNGGNINEHYSPRELADLNDESEVVVLPRSIANSETIDCPIVVLPNIRNEYFTQYVDLPLVNFPIGVRTCSIEQDPYIDTTCKTDSHISLPGLEELFPESIRKTRSISSRNFY